MFAGFFMLININKSHNNSSPVGKSTFFLRLKANISLKKFVKY